MSVRASTSWVRSRSVAFLARWLSMPRTLSRWEKRRRVEVLAGAGAREQPFRVGVGGVPVFAALTLVPEHLSYWVRGWRRVWSRV